MLRRRIVWTVVLVLAALGGAGLATAADRAPTDEARPELTWRAEQRAAPLLAQMEQELAGLALDVDLLSAAGRGALSGVPALDAEAIEDAAANGDAAISAVAPRVAELSRLRDAQQALVPDDRLGRTTREALLAIDAVIAGGDGLTETWIGMSARASAVADLLNALEAHDALVLDATAAGRDSAWSEALELLENAERQLALARGSREVLAVEGDVTTLDGLLGRYADFDAALVALYAAIERTGSSQGPEIDELRAEVDRARGALPQTTGALSVAAAEAAGERLARGLVQIEELRGAIADARAALAGDPE